MIKHWYFKVFSFLVSINLIISPFIGLYIWVVHLLNSTISFWDLTMLGIIVTVAVTLVLISVNFGTVLLLYYLSQKDEDKDKVLAQIFG